MCTQSQQHNFAATSPDAVLCNVTNRTDSPAPNIVVLQDLHGKGDEETRVALLKAANDFFPGSAAHPSPSRARSDTGLQQASTGKLTGCSSPGDLPSSQPLSSQSPSSGRLHALSEPGCSTLPTTTSEALESSASSSAALPSKPSATKASICSVETASQTVPAEAPDATITPHKGASTPRASITHSTGDIRDTGGPQAHDIAKKYLSQSQDVGKEQTGSRWPHAGRPNALGQAPELEECPPEAELSLPSPNATDLCGWSDRASHSDIFGVCILWFSSVWIRSKG